MAGAAHSHAASPALKSLSRKPSQLAAFSFFEMDAVAKIEVGSSARKLSYDVEIGTDLLSRSGDWIKSRLPINSKKAVIVSNDKVFALYGDSVSQSLSNVGFEVSVWLMKDGERYKNLESLSELLSFFSTQNLTRTDFVVALGGGVVGDLAGFAASIYLRGLPFFNCPTTLLSMIDASVGGKTAVNTEFGKNLVGSFYNPKGVLVDFKTLATLDPREISAGSYEAIKHGVVGSRTLFDNTARFLGTYPAPSFADRFDDWRFATDLQKFLYDHIAFKAQIVMGDEFEAPEATQSRSRKILNFGHTIGHALEKATEYAYFKHGEAVAYGMLGAAEVSRSLEILDKVSLESLNDVVDLVADLPKTDNIETDRVIDAFIFDKKNAGESLSWILLESIGNPIIVDESDIPQPLIEEALEKILSR